MYNGCLHDILLSDYEMFLCHDGCEEAKPGAALGRAGLKSAGAQEVEWGKKAGPPQRLASGATYVISYCVKINTPQCADYSLLLHSQAILSLGLGDGNDYFGLFHKPTDRMVDSIGTVGYYPVVGWAVAGVADATHNHRIERKPSVSHGNCGDWTRSAGSSEESSEWQVSSPHHAIGVRPCRVQPNMHMHVHSSASARAARAQQRMRPCRVQPNMHVRRPAAPPRA